MTLIEGAVSELDINTVVESPKQQRQKSYGIHEGTKYEETTVGIEAHRFKNFVRFYRRSEKLLETGLNETHSPRDVDIEIVRDWSLFSSNPEAFWQREKGKLVERNIQELKIIDIGAGRGALLDYFEQAGCLPKELTLAEPFHYDGLAEKCNGIFEPLGYIKEETPLGVTFISPDGKYTIRVIKEKFGSHDNHELQDYDLALIAGVAPFYPWKGKQGEVGFKDIVDEAETCVKPGGRVAFSFSIEPTDLKDLKLLPAYIKAKLERKKWNKYRYTPEELSESGIKLGDGIFIGNFVGYKDRQPNAEDAS